MSIIKKHFEQEAHEFDKIILKLIPYYSQMLDAIVAAIPFPKEKEIKVIDLGCGTGTISKQIKKNYPNSTITCLDIAENMIKMCKLKLSKFSSIQYIVSDLQDFSFKENHYNVIVSSLALHHLKTNEEKKQFYNIIYKSLKQGGIFLNADVVLGATDFTQQVFMQKWISFMKQHVSVDEINNKWLPKYHEEDKPAKLIDHLAWLSESGFNMIDVIWKYYNFSVYCGQKL